MSWEGFWTLVLSGGQFLFAALAVLVGIGAFLNIGAMFRDLDRRHTGPGEEQSPGPAAAKPGQAPTEGTDAGDAGDEIRGNGP